MPFLEGLKRFYAESKHILSVSYKPTHDELVRTTKIVLIGILILGVAGFVIALILDFLLKL